MSKTLIAMGLLAIAGSFSISEALASESSDPQQRIREMIVPPPTPYHPVLKESGTQFSKVQKHVDPHVLAQNAIRDESWPPSSDGQRVDKEKVFIGNPDPQRHIRLMILGHED